MNTLLNEMLKNTLINWQTERPGGIYEESYVHWFACFHPPQPDAVVLEGAGKGKVPDPTRIAGNLMFDMGISLGKYVEQNKQGAKWVFAPKEEVIAFLLLKKDQVGQVGTTPPVVTEEEDPRVRFMKSQLEQYEKSIAKIQQTLDELNKD